MIHVNICRSVKVNAVSQGAEMLWIRILTLVDDNGNYDRDPMLVFASGAKHKKGVKLEHVVKWMDELIQVGLLQTYSFEGQDYIHFADFHDYQHLRSDRGVVVMWPIHPEDMGRGFLESGISTSVRRELETSGQPPDNHKVHQLPANPHHEVEVEVKVKREVEGKDQVIDGDFETKEPNYKIFMECWKQVTGVTPPTMDSLRDGYRKLCRRYKEQDVLDAINEWSEGKSKKERKNDYGPKNFLERSCADILDARIDAKNSGQSGLPAAEDFR